MFKATTTKSLILLSFILAFAVALQDGDQVAFKTHGNFFNAKYQYLNAGTVDGSVGMAINTDYSSASGTWWKAHKLSDGSWGFESLGNIPNAQHIYLNANTYTGSVDLAGSTDFASVSGTHWSVQTLSDGTVALKCLGSHSNPQFVYLNTNTYTGSVGLASSTDFNTLSGTHWEIVTLKAASSSGSADSGIPSDTSKLVDYIKSNANQITSAPDLDINYCLQQLTAPPLQSELGVLIQAIIQAGCTNGLQNCNTGGLNGVLSQLQGSVDATMIEKLYILTGSMIGSMAGGAACDGAQVCEWIGGKIGATLTCLSISKQVWQGMVTAVSAVTNVANQAGDLGQGAVNAIHDAANSAETGVSDAIAQINQGGSAVSALKGVTDDVGQGFTDIGNSIAGAAGQAAGAIQGAAGQAAGAVQGAAGQAGGAIAGAAGQAGGAIAGAAGQAGGAIAGAAGQAGGAIQGAFCGLFGC